MFTLRNPNLVTLLAQACPGPIMFRQGSPFSKLVTGLHHEVESLPEALAYFEKDARHEEFMSAMEEELTTILRTRVTFVRNHITATIEDLNTEITDTLDGLVPEVSGHRVVVANYPRVLTSELLLSMTDKYKEAPFQSQSIPKGVFPDLAASDLMELLNNIDDTEVRELVNELVDSLDVSITDIYAKHFQGRVIPGYPNPGELRAPSYTPFIYIERAIVFFLATGFYAKPHESVNLALDTYNSTLAVMLSNVGKQVFNNSGLINRDLKTSNKLLVTLDHSKEDATIVLRRKQYDMFLDAEMCTPETILGLFKLGTLERVSFNTTEEMDEYSHSIELANKAAKYDATIRQNVLNDSRRAVALRELIKHVTTYIESEEYIKQEGETSAMVLNRCRQVARDHGHFTIENVFFLIRKVVCLGLYPNSGALVYLEAMDRHQSENPNLTSREAATLAMCDMQCAWAMQQLV